MYSYVTRELPELIAGIFPVKSDAVGICGHSMGGHGALTLALRHPETFKSVSAFAPIVAPSEVPWGRKAFAAYHGAVEAVWRQHDSAPLLRELSVAPPVRDDRGAAQPRDRRGGVRGKR